MIMSRRDITSDQRERDADGQLRDDNVEQCPVGTYRVSRRRTLLGWGDRREPHYMDE